MKRRTDSVLGRREETRTRQPRQMAPSKGWQSKGDKSVRQRPRLCGRPFRAPRSVTKTKVRKLLLKRRSYKKVVVKVKTTFQLPVLLSSY